MANQIIIDIGAVANDGTGDPLRTAFGYVNNNFSNIWTTGVANSNIQFSGNKILTTNTNGNLVLAPNGIGKVQSNVDIVPNANNTLSLGSLTNKWNTVYAQNLAVGGNVEFNDLTVDGNLTVTGNTIQIGNITTETKTIQLANAASTANAANGSGVTVGANDNIATLLYSSTSNVWTTNIGIVAAGNITGSYFVGNGSLLTGIASPYGNANVATYLASGTNTSNIVTTNNVSANNINVTNDLYGKTGTFTGDATGDNAIYAGVPLFTNLGSDVVAQFSGNTNTYTQFNFQNGNAGSQASGDYVITADNGNDSTHFINLGITSSTWNGTQPNSLGNRLGPNDGYLYVQDGDMVIGTSNGTIETWKFDQTGNLTVPGDILPLANNTQSLGSATNQWNDLYVSNATIFMNNVPISLSADNVLTVNGNAVLQNNSNSTISTTGNITAGNLNSPTLNNSGNISVVAGGNTWAFGTNGTTIFPTLTVTRGDRSGTLTGQALLFGDSTQEAIISTPNGTNDINSSQRLVINPGKGADGTTGEGGDIYLYAGRGGDAGGSGGDIKIRGGLGPVNGAGGYITMEGGEADVNGVGGYIEIYGGLSGNSNGGYLDLRGGLGQTEGGAVFIQGGQGQAGPGGPVNITGGVSGNGLAEYGNVGVIAGASGWVFDNTGNLTLPQGGVVYETNIPYGGFSGKTIALAPAGGTSADQQLLVYPTAGADANHLHLTSGNLYNTELFLGNDDLYVKLANTGAVVINSNDSVGNTAQWTFGTTGTILNSGNLTLQTPSGIPTSLSNWQGQGGWNQAFYSNVATTGGTGTGLTVDVAAAGAGYISINDITINTPGTGYTNGDVITIDNENNLPGTFTVGVVVNDWTFDTTGVLTFPDGANIVDGAFNGTASSTVSLNAFSPDGNTVSFQAQGNTSSAVISIFSNAGPVTSNWTFTTAPLDPSESFLYVPNGGAISTPDASGGEGGKNIFIQAGASDPVTWNSNPGGELFIKGGYGSFGDGSGGAGGNVYIEGGLSSDSHAGNVNITAGSNSWVFDYSGNVTIPGNINAVLSSPAPSLNGFTSVNAVNVNASGNISGNTAGYAIGYRDIPQVSFTGNATIATTDAGKHFYSTQSSNYILTIANNASQGFQVGAAITIVNQGTGNITIAQGSGVTLYLAGNASSGNRSVATFGMATIMKVATDTWFINGTGVS
jgi:hypothetical protein